MTGEQLRLARRLKSRRLGLDPVHIRGDLDVDELVDRWAEAYLPPGERSVQ